MNNTLSRKEARRTIDAVQRARKAGGKAPGEVIRRGDQAAIIMAAQAMKASPETIRHRIGKGGPCERLYGLTVDWSIGQAPQKKKEAEAPVVAVDHKRIVALQDENAELKRQIKDAHRDALSWETIRESVLGLARKPLSPELKIPKDIKAKGARTVIIHLSDLHCGEVVQIDDMGGLNTFNLDIFKARLGRLVAKAIDLMTTHWTGDPPEKIILIFGGDLVNNELHLDAAKTNDALAAPAVKICSSNLAGVVRAFAEIAPVDVYSVPGNHGRLTLKIESKNFARDSLDTLICSLVEMMLVDTHKDRVRFFAPPSGDALLKVYHKTFAIVHGQRELRGGLGFVGPFAAILRGWQKVHAYYAAQGIAIDAVFSGHLHTAGYIPAFGVANGSLPGPNDFSRDLRCKPEPASQNMIVVHSELGIIDVKQLFVGHPDEGSIYNGYVQ